jgi:hypothetical protein
VAHNLDRLPGQLTPMGAPPLVRGLIDSAFTPSLDQWDLSASLDCTSRGLCNFKDVLNDQRAHSLWKQRFDDSCIAFHPMDDWLCFDGPHVLTHHVTTPFFVRQGLDDQLLSQNAIDAGYQVPGQGTLTVRQWGTLVRQNLLALAGIDANTEEKPAAVPGAFGPLCNKHDTLGSNADIFGVTISGAAMFDVWTKWADGAAVQTVSSRAGDTVCPP